MAETTTRKTSPRGGSSPTSRSVEGLEAELEVVYRELRTVDLENARYAAGVRTASGLLALAAIVCLLYAVMLLPRAREAG